MTDLSKALRQPPTNVPINKEKQVAIVRKALRRPIKEDGVGMVGGTPVNNAGGGEIAGIGVGPKGEPGVSSRKKPMPFKSFFKRKAPQ
mgnify:FL=1